MAKTIDKPSRLELFQKSSVRMLASREYLMEVPPMLITVNAMGALTREEWEQLKQEAEAAKLAACQNLEWVCSLEPPTV